jgi:mRNA interferase RelE/StbE
VSEIWRYEFTPPAMHDMRQLDTQVRRRIFAALDRLIANNGQGDIVKLAGVDNEFRLRVGEWRVRFTRRIVEEIIEGVAVRVHMVDVLRVLPRGRAYR